MKNYNLISLTMERVTNSFSISLILLPLFIFQSCLIVRNTHNDAVDVGYFNNKNEGHAALSLDFNDETSGLNGNFMYSPANNFMVGGGISAFTYKVFYDDIGPDDFNYDYYEDDGNLSGYKFMGNAGYYVHFGNKRPGIVEVLLTLSYGKNTLDLAEDETKLNYKHFEYNPFSTSLQFGLGRMVRKLSVMGGVKFQRYFFDKKVPVYQNDYNYFSVKAISYVQPFLDL